MNFYKKHSFLKCRAFTLAEMAITVGVIGIAMTAIFIAYGQLSTNRKVQLAADEIRFIVNKTQITLSTNPSALAITAPSLACGVVKWDCPCNTTLPPIPVPPPCVPATVSGGCMAPCIPAAWCVQGSANIFNSASGPLGVQTSGQIAGMFPQSMVKSTGPVSPWGTVVLAVQESSNACTVDGGAAAAAAFATLTIPGTGTSVNMGLATKYYIIGTNFFLTFNSVPAAACSQLLLSYGTELTGDGLTSVTFAGTPIVMPLTPATISAGCTGAASGALAMNYSIVRP